MSIEGATPDSLANARIKNGMEAAMLSPEKRQQIEREGAREIRRFHRDVQPLTFASVIDDIRHKVVEEGWYGRQVTGNIGDARVSHDATHERGSETVEVTSVYGEPPAGWGAANGPAAGRDIHGNPMEPTPPEKKGPEAGL
jgi:hypothetical protein